MSSKRGYLIDWGHKSICSLELMSLDLFVSFYIVTHFWITQVHYIEIFVTSLWPKATLTRFMLAIVIHG